MFAHALIRVALFSLLLPLAASSHAAVTNVAYWRFGENDPGAVNGATTNNTVNLLGGTLGIRTNAIYTNVVAAKASNQVGSTLGLRFNSGNFGTNALVSTLTNNFGIELWVRPDTNNVTQCLAYNGNSGSSGWGLYLLSSGQYVGLFGGAAFVGTATATNGVWAHLALVRDSGVATLYVNGVPSGSAANNPNPPTGQFAVATQPQSLTTEFFTGSLDEVRVFSFAPGGFSTNDLLINNGLLVTTTANSGAGSLRDVIAATAPGGTVRFATNLSGQTLTLTNEILLTKSLTLTATNLPAGVTVSGGGTTRLFSITNSATIAMSNLTLISGNGAGAANSGSGSAIYVFNGSLTMARCKLSGNSAAFDGGAITSAGSLTLNQCTLSGNSAGNEGGAIKATFVSLTQCTLSGNSANSKGGALSVLNALTLVQCTISENNAVNTGGGLYANLLGTHTATNSIVAGNSAPSNPNVDGSFSLSVSNLTSGNPLLAPLGNYGGPTPTRPPLPGSPALDAGSDSVTNSLATDQRGLPRLVGAHVDIGAVENAPPTASNLSAAETYIEDTALNLVDIVVSDLDSTNVTATLTLSNPSAGALSTGTSGAVTSTFSAGVWTASGAIASVNALLAGVTFTPALNFNANFTIATSVSDGIAPAVTGSKAMTGTAVNDAPTATNLSAPETYTEDTALNLVDIVVNDVDNATTSVTLTLSNPSAGTLSTGTSGAVTSTFSAGVWTASGAIASVNALLAGVTFTPALNFNANFTIATSVSDGIAPADTGSKAMTGTAVNDAPTATNLSAPETYTEDTALNLVDIVVSDADNATTSVTLTLSNPAAGSLSTGTSGPVTSTFSAGVWTASGPIANVNALLAGVIFTPALHYTNNFTIATSVSDGIAPPLTGSKVMTGFPASGFIVTTTSNSDPGSLRDVIAAVPAGSTITFATNLFGQTITLTNEIILNKNLTITATNLAANVIISGAGTTRLFYINNNPTITMSNLTLTGGNGVGAANSGSGGAIGLFNGSLTMTRCTLSGNSASGGGGAINANSPLALNQCTLSGNSTSGSGGAINGTAPITLNQCTLSGNISGISGGAVYQLFQATLTQCTLSSNSASFSGGALYTQNILNLGQCTITENNANSGGGIAQQGAGGGSTYSTNSIIAGNTASSNPNISGSLASSVSNLLSGNPLLAPLGNYGGPTPTRPPLPGSPAIDAGANSITNSLTTDQRGFPRLVGAQVDIGAVESGSAIPGFDYSVVTITNDVLNDGLGGVSLRTAVANVPAGSTITFATNLAGQTITLTNEIVLNKNLTLTATNLPSNMVISGGDTTRIFYITNSSNITMNNLALTGGNGAGALNYGLGGAVHARNGSLTLTRCTLSGNSGNDGGAINSGGTLTLNQCLLSGNGAGTGGAIYARSTTTLAQCTLSGNGAGTGGAIYTLDSTTLTECTFSGNTVGGQGGAVRAVGTMTLTQCTLSGNSAGYSGGAISAFSGLTLVQCTLAENNASVGGGIFNNSGSITATNSIIAGNTVTATDTNLNVSLSGVNNLTNGNPLLAPLGDYGGPTQTRPPLIGSPAIDAGDNSVTNSLSADQRGLLRFVGVQVDIGAVEGAFSTSFPIVNFTKPGNSTVQFAFTNLSGPSYRVLASTNVAAPIVNWSDLGAPTESPSGVFTFTDLQATNYPQRFYRAVKP